MNPFLWRLRFYVLAILVCCLVPLLLVYLIYRAWIIKRPMTGFARKLSGSNSANPHHDSIMIHGVSMGEVNLMRPLVPLIEEAFDKSCFLSSSTDTGIKSLEKHFADHHRCIYPLDVPWAVARFLNQQKPSLIILLELEIWPLFLAACFHRQIPVVILNARVGEKSYKSFKRFSWFWRPIFKSLHAAIAQNKAWAERLQALGMRQVEIGTSLKADVVSVANDADKKAERERLQLDDRPIFLGASTGQNEEAVLLDAITSWADDWQLIICPRHPERGAQIQQLVEAAGLSGVRTSHHPEAPAIDGQQVIIVDEIGRLGALYGLADIAVVGGSIGSGRHGQNMLEAAAAGCCTVVGWDTSNQVDAMALLHEHQAVVECADAQDLHKQLQALAEDEERRQALGQAGKSAWESSTGAAERSVQSLAQMLNNN